MESGTRPVKGTRKMIAAMTPVLQDGTFVFCSLLLKSDASEAASVSLGMFAEDEGLSLILKRSDADRFDLAYDKPMRQITLMVYQSVSAVGMTSMVTSELARATIPTKVVTASQHVHLFVHSDKADEAMEKLRALHLPCRNARTDAHAARR